MKMEVLTTLWQYTLLVGVLRYRRNMHEIQDQRNNNKCHNEYQEVKKVFVGNLEKRFLSALHYHQKRGLRCTKLVLKQT